LFFIYLVHSKQNGNGAAYPVRPYRSKDYLISSEPSTLHRPYPPLKSMYSTADEIIPNRRSILKETDLDHIINLSSERSNGTIKTLPINRNRTLFSTPDSQKEEYNESNQVPITIQRRSSFQTATKLNSLDFYKPQEPFYFLDKQLIKPIQRNHYSPDREKRRDYSPYLKADINQHNNHMVENQMLTNNDQQSRESNSTNEFDRDNQNFILYNNDRNEDRYRDDGIFV
jgi:hypothetical protein